MIYFYSATGNTRFAAKYLAATLGTKAIDILRPDFNEAVSVSENQPTGFMFPIYCWGIPPVMSRFIDSLLPEISKESYVWAVCTCGDEAGTAMKSLNRKFKKIRGRALDAVYSLIMPNTYVMLPGFDVDSKEVERRKLEEAPSRLDRIAKAIGEGKSDIYDVSEGALPALRSALFPLFEKWGVREKWWHVSPDCIGCGKCARICPSGNISMHEDRPRWSDHCFSCCACYHCCPVKAISYSGFTRDKSQYLCPL